MASKKDVVKSDKPKGGLIYHSKEESKHTEGGVTEITEKQVMHAEDTLFCKFYQKKGGHIVKYDVKAPGTGGQYVLTTTIDGEKKQTQHTKAELIAFLKSHDELKFMLDYIGKVKSLARPTGSAGKKPVAKKPTVSVGKKPVAKKPTASADKKLVAKKPVAKKPTGSAGTKPAAKKPAVKKPATKKPTGSAGTKPAVKKVAAKK
jgi:hypothetical protein